MKKYVQQLWRLCKQPSIFREGFPENNTHLPLGSAQIGKTDFHFFLKVKMLLKLAGRGEGPPAQIDVDSNLGNAQNKGCFFLGSLPFDVTPRNTRFMSFLPTALIDS